MRIPPELRCFHHTEPLTPVNGGGGQILRTLACSQGCYVPVIGGIPRFVPSENYASGFGLQWKTFRQTQLDSYTGLTISRDRLERLFRGALEVVNGKSVLEAGCGAGRFTELLLESGARVFACDLSEAVEANYENCRAYEDYFVCQANILELPVAPAAFDVVLCVGVIQHTPDPEKTIRKLASYIRPGGTLVIDHYAHGISMPFTRKVLRQWLLRMSPATAKQTTLNLARLLMPLHRLLHHRRRGYHRLRRYLRRVSPLADYYDDYPQLDGKLLEEWSVLDTHDMLTDRYKHLRSTEQIRECLLECGLTDVEVSYGGNGVEARARRPLQAVAVSLSGASPVGGVTSSVSGVSII